APAMSGSPHGVFCVQALPASATSGCVCASIDREPNATMALTAAIPITAGKVLGMRTPHRPPITDYRSPITDQSSCMLLRPETIEVSFVSALIGVGCAPLLHLFSCCLLAATVAAAQASHHYRRLGPARGRHLDHGVDRALGRSRLGAVSL